MPGERTEAPTPRRIREARGRGDAAKSQELVSIGVLLAAVAALRLIGPGIWGDLRDGLVDALTDPSTQDLTLGGANDLTRASIQRLLLTLTPLFGVLIVAAIAFNVGQAGFILTGQKLKPKLEHLSPIKGTRRILSLDGLVNLAKALLKMAIVAIVVVITVRGQMNEIVGLGGMTTGEATAALFAFSFDIALRAAIALFVLALADYLWQRRRHQQQLKMSVQDVRQEMKETDGDPQIRAAMRRRRQQLVNRMIAAVPGADVVVTNPTHYAVAIRYDAVSMQAPLVVAKGQRLVAQRIKDVARESGVPVLEEPALARALFAAVEIGQPIPASLYKAVAEVLAWVYSLRSRLPWTAGRTSGAQGAI